MNSLDMLGLGQRPQHVRRDTTSYEDTDAVPFVLLLKSTFAFKIIGYRPHTTGPSSKERN